MISIHISNRKPKVFLILFCFFIICCFVFVYLLLCMKASLTTSLHCGLFRCRSIRYIVWLFGLSGSVVFVVGWEFMTQVKTCLCVPFLFGFHSFTIFLVKNKASASFSFGKWPAFFIGIDVCKWDNANPLQITKPFWVQQVLPLSPIVQLQWLLIIIIGLHKWCSKIVILIAFQPFS